MASQLPSEVVGPAAGILFYSFICLICGLFLFWLVWTHNEWRSYISMLASLMNLGATASIIQQIHTIARWRDIKTEQHRNLVENVGNPELNITGASTGIDLVLFYIQYYTYTAESMLVFFWAVELAYSIFQLQRYKFRFQRGSQIAKGSAIILPAILMGVLRTKAAQSNVVLYMFLANSVMIISMTGSFILLAILIKYMRSKRALGSFKVQYGQPWRAAQSSHGAASQPTAHNAPKTIYDNWLVVRFTIAFIALALFQLVVFMFQIRAINNNKAKNIPKQPDLTISKAKGDFALFAPGVSAGLLLYVVFGTTRSFREYTANLFFKIPQRWRVMRSSPGRTSPGLGKKNNDIDSQDNKRPALPPVPYKEYPMPRPAYHPSHRHQQQDESPHRSSISWYGARPSDSEAGYGEFSPVSETSEGTITLKYLDPGKDSRADARPSGGNLGDLERGRKVVSQNQWDGPQRDGDVEGEVGDEDQWPMLRLNSPPHIVTALAPRPRTRA